MVMQITSIQLLRSFQSAGFNKNKRCVKYRYRILHSLGDIKSLQFAN